MNSTVVYRLYFKGPAHPGERGVGRETVEETLHSDTLFNALLFALRLWKGNSEVERWLRLFLERRPPFLLTSAFPFAQETLFFPQPLKRFPEKIPSEIKGRRLKNVRWFPSKVFTALLKNMDKDLQAILEESLPEKEPWEREMVPRVALDRATGTSQLFWVKRIYFDRECGLWFAVHYQDASLRQELEALLRILEELGIGGERSQGCGRFDFKAEEAPDFLVPYFGEGEAITLSLWAPKKEELSLLPKSHYQLKLRSGWLLSPDTDGAYRSQEVYLIAEGAIIPKGGPLGRLVDVTPRQVFNRHPVYRYGFAYPVAG